MLNSTPLTHIDPIGLVGEIKIQTLTKVALICPQQIHKCQYDLLYNRYSFQRLFKAKHATFGECVAFLGDRNELTGYIV